MGLLIRKEWLGDPKFIAQASISVPTQPPAIPADFARQDWGLAIGILFLVGNKLWQMLSGQLTADTKLQTDLINDLRAEVKALRAELFNRKP
jgi:hypothetical protein